MSYTRQAALIAGCVLSSAGAEVVFAADPHAEHAMHHQHPPVQSQPVSPNAATHEHHQHAAAAPSGADKAAQESVGHHHSQAEQTDGLRDPHAHSGGLQLGEGPYALPGGRSLHLADEHSFARFAVDRLERSKGHEDYATVWEAEASWGRDYDRAVLRLEGERAGGKLEESTSELLWQHALTNFWNTELGLRHDSGEAPDQNWLALGVSGLAPYWLEVDAFLYLAEGGQQALALEAEYELLLTQRLVLQPSLELVAYSEADHARHRGKGLSELAAGARLRYEFSRNFAPYLGFERARLLGDTADLARGHGEASGDTRWIAGVRFWF